MTTAVCQLCDGDDASCICVDLRACEPMAPGGEWAAMADDIPAVAAAKRILWDRFAFMEQAIDGMRVLVRDGDATGLRNAVSALQEGQCPVLRLGINDLDRAVKKDAAMKERAGPPKPYPEEEEVRALEP